MEKRDVRPIAGIVGPERGHAEAAQIVMRIQDRDEDSWLGGPPFDLAGAEPKRRRRADQPVEFRYSGRLVENRDVRLDAPRHAGIPASAELVDPGAQSSNERSDRDAPGRLLRQFGVCASVSAW